MPAEDAEEVVDGYHAAAFMFSSMIDTRAAVPTVILASFCTSAGMALLHRVTTDALGNLCAYIGD